MRILVRLLIVSCLAAATSLSATVFQSMPDRDLVDRSQAVVIATVHDSSSHLRSDGYVGTESHLIVEETLKGSVANLITVSELGGATAGRITFISDSAVYAPGERVLVFLRSRGDGTYFTTSMAMGKFSFTRDERGEALLTRDVSELHEDPSRLADMFAQFVRDRSQGLSTAGTYEAKRVATTALRPIATAAASAYVVTGCGPPGCFPVRVEGGESGLGLAFRSAGTLAGVDGPGGIASAAAAWTNDPGAGIVLSYAGTSNSTAPDPEDGNNIVYLGYSGPDSGFCDGTIGCTIGVGNVTHPFQGTTFISISDADILIRPGVSAALFPTLITHEIGHAIGFRHSDAGTPSSSSAVMTTTVNQTWGFTLQAWDQEANNAVYGTGPVCTPPSIGTQPQDVTITAGQSTTLSVGATGTSLTYQWYIGTSGNTGTTAPNGTSNQLLVSPSVTTSYWVRVSGCATPANSRTATVTVTQPTCVPPSASTPTAFPSSISSGQSSTLSESPTGTSPFTYQWFAGSSGDQSNPITGATSSSAVVSPTATTSYWVKVTGQCAPPSNSPAVTVTVACTPIAFGSVVAQPSTINVGQSSTLSVNTSGSGPFTFQWYRGSIGDASNPIFGATGSSTVVSPTTSTAYWVHVTAPCGSQDGNVTVFVNAPCTQSSITTHPSFATIAPGGSATLTVVAAGTAPISYQWYTGTSGNTGSPIPNATNASITVSPTVTTSYWVRVSNSCNTVGNNSVTALVTVSATCPAPAITTQPASVSAPIGTAATLNVVATATGTTIHYQWYKGAKGDLSTKVGLDSPTFTTGTVAVTASYWVRLTSACNNLAFTDSNAAIVTAIAPPRGHAVRH
ncbi:MAG: trimeric autotransporter adhesin [Thermoanaerobaculia bacterium]|jgi:hypothetical protein|nr:trimeric autotransporter adhesin [Thermoanaerobaculia bacterium]